MTMTTINKELYEALKIAKVPEKEAHSAAENFLPIKEIATKRDLVKLEGKLEKKMVEVENKLGKKMVEMESKLEKNMMGLENRLTWRLFGMSLSSSALIVALVKFL